MTLEQLLALENYYRTTARFLTRRLWYRTVVVAGFAILSFLFALTSEGPAFVIAFVGTFCSLYAWLKIADDVRRLNSSMRRNAKLLRDHGWQR